MAGVAGAGRPNEIKNPVAAIANQVTPQVAPMPVPAPTSDAPMAGVPDSSVPAEAPPAADPFAELDSPQAAASSSDPFAELDTQAPQAPQETQVPSLATRFKSSFAATDDQKSQALEQQFGKENVRKAGKGEFEVKVDNKWKKISGDDSFIGMLADNAKSYLDTTLIGGGAAAAAIPGSVIPGAGTAAGGMLGAGIGGAVAEGANQAARSLMFDDRTGQSGLDTLVGQSSDLASAFNTGVAAEGAGVLLGKGTGALAKKLSVVTKWAANHEATQAVANKLANGTEALQNSYQQILKMQDELKSAGYIDNLPGADTFLAKPQLGGRDAAEGSQLIPQKVVDGVESAQQNILKNGIDRFFNSVSNFGKQISNVGDRFQAKISNLQQAEGSFIGNWEKRAVEASGDGMLPVSNTQDAIANLNNTLGLARDGDKLVGPHPEVRQDVDSIVSMLDTKPAQARDLLRKVRDMGAQLFNDDGRMTMQDLHSYYKKVSTMTNSFNDETVSTGYGRQMIQLKNALRDDLIKLSDTVLDGNGEYQAARKSYSEIKDGVDLFSNILSKDGVTSRTLANTVFTSGRDGLQYIRGMKQLLQNKDPELWKDLVGQYLNNITKTDANGVIDFKSMQGSLRNLGTESLHEVFGAEKAGQLDNFLKLANLTQKNSFKAGSSGEVGLLAQAAKLKTAGINILVKMGMGGNPILDNISKEGIERYVSQVGKAQQGPFRMFLNDLLQAGREAVSTGAQPLAEATQNVSTILNNGGAQTAGAAVAGARIQ